GLHGNCLLAAGAGTAGTVGIGGIISSAQQLRVGSHKLCGPVLANAMDMVCVGGYNSMLYGKRGQQQQQQRQARRALLTSLYGGEVLVKTQRRRRQQRNVGIYDECCVNSCSYDELLAYCRRK
ncbi:hypothetical protein KR222_009230, partial [Zaprionus bogoriensis]